MKFYITIESVPKLKRSFLNLKLFSVISVQDILDKYGYTYEIMDDYSSYIVNRAILDYIKTYSRSKRSRGIIFSNPNLNKESIDNLYELLANNEDISDVILFDDYNVPRVQHLYENFDEIIFFPSIKKIRLIECRPIEDKLQI
jgi:hypothetical protein